VVQWAHRVNQASPMTRQKDQQFKHTPKIAKFKKLSAC